MPEGDQDSTNMKLERPDLAPEAGFTTSRRFSDDAAATAFAALAPGADPELRAARSNRTVLQYRSAVRVFCKWCEDHGHVALPATGETFAAWVRAMILERRTVATIAAYRGAIAAWHRLNGHRLDAGLAAEWMRAARRQSGPPRRARALLADDLRAVLATLDPVAPADCRDAALLLLQWGAALRSDEVVSLDWAREGAHAAGGKGAAILEADGVRVTLRRAKTSQATRVDVPVPDADLPPLRAWLERWIAVAGIAPGTPLFRPVSRGVVRDARLGSPSVRPIVRRRMLRAALARGVDEREARIAAEAFTAHSPRRGLLTDGVANGVDFATLRRRSRHRSDAQLIEYVDENRAWTDSGIRWGKS